MKPVLALFLAFFALQPALSTAETAPAFGDDASKDSNDNECDDPRFTGWGVATVTSEEEIGHDATDCAHLFNLGQIRLNRTQDQSNTAECAAVNFGDNSSEWADDRECDDPRFFGGAADNILSFKDIGRDAKDCRAACETGKVWLR